MGCDIHLFQEKKVDGKWVTADKWSLDPERGIESEYVSYKDALYSGRNYRLFSVLAGVRNGAGFAGVRTGDPVTPISQPRGVPDDCCVQCKAEVERWGRNAHSHSWLTLDDIVDYRWHRAIKRGVVPLDVWRRWKRDGVSNPETWAGGVSGRGIVIIPEAAAAALNPTFNDDKTYVEAEWSTSLRDDCDEFMKAVTPRLQQLEMECGRGNARIVFFFDN